MDIERRLTTDGSSGKVLEDVFSGSYGLRASELGKRLDTVRDLEVLVELRDAELARAFDTDGGEQQPGVEADEHALHQGGFIAAGADAPEGGAAGCGDGRACAPP